MSHLTDVASATLLAATLHWLPLSTKQSVLLCRPSGQADEERHGRMPRLSGLTKCIHPAAAKGRIDGNQQFPSPGLRSFHLPRSFYAVCVALVLRLILLNPAFHGRSLLSDVVTTCGCHAHVAQQAFAGYIRFISGMGNGGFMVVSRGQAGNSVGHGVADGHRLFLPYAKCLL